MNRQHTKVRHVKCPKCARILPEPEQVPLYTCGGCDTILQAKYYRSNKEALVPTLPTKDVVQSNGNVDHGPEVEKSSGSSQKSSGEQSLIHNEENNEKAVDDCNSDQIGDGIRAHHTSLSEEFSVLKIKDGRQVGAANSPSGLSSNEDHSIVRDKEAEKLPMEIETRKDGSDHHQYNGVVVENQDNGQIRKVNYTCETSSRREIEVLENQKPQQPGRVNEPIQDENDKREQCEDNGSGKEESMPIKSQPIEKSIHFETIKMDLGGEHSIERVSGNEINYLAEDKPITTKELNNSESLASLEMEMVEDKPIVGAKFVKEDKNGKEQKSFIERMREKFASVTNSIDGPTSTEVQDGNENSLPGGEANLGAYVSNSERIASDVPRDPGCEISLSDNVEETLRQKSENSDDCYFDGSGPTCIKETSRQKAENFDDSDFDRSGQNRPANKAETLEPVDTHEKVDDLRKGIPRSPTKRSPAYDGSVSSCDGNDDQVLGGTFSGDDAVAGYVGAEENPEWNDVPSSRIKYGNLRTRARDKSSSCQLSGEKLKRGMVQEQESVRENDRNALFPRKVPFHRRSSEMAFETGSSSSYVHDEPPSHWKRNNQYRHEDQEPWRRKIYPGREYLEGRRFSEASSRENDHLPMYYNDEIPGKFYQKPRYQGYSSDSRGQAESLFLSGNLTRTRYSGEEYNRRYQIQDHYMHRYPDARRWSTQLPSGPTGAPQAGYYRQGPMTYMDPSGETSWDSYDPYPQRVLDFELYGWAHDTVYLSDDQRHRDRVTRRPYIREKRQAVKRHLRPMAGAAPFITCHLCFRVLQLPEEFLLSKQRKIHRLKCGACSNVLEFSLENDSCLAPHLPYAGETNPERDIRLASPSRASQSHESILVSENNSEEALDREKSKLVPNNSRAGQRLDEPRGVKVTWQMPAPSKSPLHRLMGYSSPQDLLTAHDTGNDTE